MNAEQEGDAVQLFPVYACILPVAFDSGILPEEVPEKHVVELVAQEEIAVA